MSTAEAAHHSVLADSRSNQRTKVANYASVSPSFRRDTAASFLCPSDSALRANPFSEGTDLICRLPLPTLFKD
jgi:hypothetical protein